MTWALERPLVHRASVYSLTVYIVVDFSSIMQQPELISTHHFSGLSVSQLMTEVENKAESEGVSKLLLSKCIIN